MSPVASAATERMLTTMFDDITISKTRRVGETELTASATFPSPRTKEDRDSEVRYWTDVIDRMVGGSEEITSFGSGLSFPKSDE